MAVRRFQQILLYSLLVLAFAGCGSAGRFSAEPQINPELIAQPGEWELFEQQAPRAIEGTDLPADTRTVSETTFERPGAAFYNSREAYVYPPYTWALLASPPRLQAFARYRFGPVDPEDDPTLLTVNISGTQAYQIGYIDYDLNTWVWSGLLVGTQEVELPPGAARPTDRNVFVDVRPWYNKRIVVLSVEVSTTTNLPPPIEPPDVSIARWQGNAAAAVSLSFDDSTQDHWSAGLPLWDDYGFNVTLGILTQRFTDEPARWPQLQQALDAGHELANHTHTHPDLTQLTAEEIAAEFDTCTALILQHAPTALILSVVTPYTLTNETVEQVAGERFLFVRGGDRGITESTPDNDWQAPEVLNLLSYAPLNMLPMSQWNGTIDHVLGSGNWLIEQCHGIGVEGDPGVGWSPRPVSEYAEHYDYIQAQGDLLWVDTIGKVGRYITQRNLTQVSVAEANADWITLELASELDPVVYTVALTLRVAQVEGWDSIVVTQGEQVVPYTTTGDGHWLLDAQPTGGPVTLTRSE